MGLALKVSGASYDAALEGVPVVAERKVGFGRQVTLEAADRHEAEAWIDRMAEKACDLADVDDWNTVNALYRDIEKIGLATA